ncbi:MAG TPA: trypsin-like peptidase domain-containing protein [Gemmataceae bacterium]|nr:trypsin-like peptidase domain-containing protein [Gemmataceae bacterium]
MPTDDYPVLPHDDPPRPPRRMAQPRPEAPPGSFRPLLYLLLLVFGVGLGVAGFWVGGKLLDQIRRRNEPLNNPEAQLRTTTPKAPLDADETEAVDLFKSVRDSVVNVDLVVVKRSGFDDSRLLEQQTGTGSGFIWDEDGRVVTNFHVIQDAGNRPNTKIRVVLSDRSAYEAAVVGTAPQYDLAVLKIDAPKEKLKPIPVGTSHDLEVGQKAFAIGNPYGLSLTMTKGIISALDRTIESPTGAPISGAIQIDAAINPGNSGGPLLDKSGRLIGVNTSITSPSGGNVGIGFAIPVDTVNAVVTEVIRTGRTVKPDLGVRLYDQRAVRRAGYDKGVMVEEAVAGGPADAAGIRGVRRNPNTGRNEPGDLIIAINGEEIGTADDYQRAVAKLKPGQQVSIKILRIEKRQEHEMDLTLTVRGV